MSETPTPKSLATKLAEVMAAVHRIPKRGRNDFHKYDYATEADISEAIRKELAERHVILLPEIVASRREPVGDKGSALTTIEMVFSFIDGDSGESLARHWLGAGTDKEDKGLYKAMTGGEKYFLLKTFLLPTGDDPEAHDGEKKKAAEPKVVTTPQKTDTPVVIPAGAVLLQKTEQHETETGKQYWLIVLSTGEEVICWKEPQAIFAEQSCQNQEPVVITTQGGMWNGKPVIRTILAASELKKPNGDEPTVAQIFNKTVPAKERAW